jgi:glycosyltransferase involved in cell wall biosynthesis
LLTKEFRLKIGIDARFITRQPRRGIGNYSLNLVNELTQIDPKIEYVLYIAHPDDENILPNLPNVKIHLLWPSIYPLWENIALPIAVKKDKIDLLHCLGNTAPLFLQSSVKLVISIMDVMFLQTDDFMPKPNTRYQAWGRSYRSLLVPFVARSADKIVTISEFSKNDILHLIPGVSLNKVQVTHLSCDSYFKFRPDNPESSIDDFDDVSASPYILCLGAEDPRKNTFNFVRAFLNLLKKNGISENLVITGYANWERSAAFEAVCTAGAKSRVKFLNFVSINKLALLYSNATAFAYPSLYEGFGIPILEAFSSGCPVIASNATSIPEVGGDAALYFDPWDVSAIEAALLKIICDSELRKQLIACGLKRANEFTWSETARKTLSIYNECLNGERV